MSYNYYASKMTHLETSIYNDDGIIIDSQARIVGIYGLSTSLKFLAQNTFGDTGEAHIFLQNDDPTLDFGSTNSGGENSRMYMYAAGAYFQDNRGTPVGIQYTADYSASFTGDSLITKTYSDGAISAAISAIPVTIRAGSYTGTGTVTTTFTVTIGATMSGTSYKVVTEGLNALSSAVHYVTNKTTTTFDVVYLTGLTGSVKFDWILSN